MDDPTGGRSEVGSSGASAQGVVGAIRAAVLDKLPDAMVEVTQNSGGHFAISVKSPAFQGRSMLESHRLVYAAIAPLMAGDTAPVHAIDTLRTIAG